MKRRLIKHYTILLALLAFSAGLFAGTQKGLQSALAQNAYVPYAAQAKPTPKPSPTPASSALPAQGAPKTLEELRTRLQEILRQPQLAPAEVGIKVVSLDTGRTLFEENAGKRLMPASNMKIYTVAAALDRLSPDYSFKTSVYAAAKPDAAGNLTGDLIIYGRGDPTLAARFNEKDYYKAIDELAERIVGAGVKRVEGDLVGDESYFTGPPLGFGWEWDDLQWYFGAEVSALSVNDNSVDLFVKPGASEGTPCIVTTGPPVSSISILNRTTTGARGTKRDLVVHRGFSSNVIEVGGQLPLDDRGYSGSIAVPHPALLFVEMLRTELERRGVKFTGRVRTIDASERAGIAQNPFRASSPAKSGAVPTTSLVEITSRQSPPLSLIAAQTLKPSQNLYAEMLLRTLGKAAGNSVDPKLETVEAGLEVVRAFLREAGVNTDAVVLRDGSGLSRHSLITADATVQLLTYMSRHRFNTTFRDALPVAGLDGTLRNRFKGTPAANNVRAKTGTIDMVSSLSGYVTTAAGERLVFSIIVNNMTGDTSLREGYIDAMTILLAGFSGHS